MFVQVLVFSFNSLLKSTNIDVVIFPMFMVQNLIKFENIDVLEINTRNSYIWKTFLSWSFEKKFSLMSVIVMTEVI